MLRGACAGRLGEARPGLPSRSSLHRSRLGKLSQGCTEPSGRLALQLSLTTEFLCAHFSLCLGLRIGTALSCIVKVRHPPLPPSYIVGMPFESHVSLLSPVRT